tara:strand:+ start:22733 stop:24850 length:2118 start_codon:yes stop_codon:yes gene_type:complete
MADDLTRLENGLREAANSGDKVAAQRIAQELRNRRAMSDQEGKEKEAAPLPTPDPTPPDPFATVPLEISGVTLSDSQRQGILDARDFDDPKQKRLFAAKLAGTIAQQSDGGGFADQVASGQFGAGLRGLVNIFGIGDMAAAAGTAMQGIGDENAMSFGEALEANRAFRHGLEEEFPVTSIASEVVGSIAGGSAAVKGISLLAKGGGKIPQVINAVTKMQKGQWVKNIGRASVAGGTSGAITEGMTEGTPMSGAVMGLAAGPLGAGLVKAGAITGGAVKKLLDDPAAAGIKAMAKKMGTSAEVMAKRFLEFKTVTGKNPALADIMNESASVELGHMIKQAGNEAVATARQGAEAATRGRGDEIAEQLVGGRVTTTRGAQEASRKNVAEVAFAKADDDVIKFSGKEVEEILNDADFRAGLPRTLKRRLDAAADGVDEGMPINLTGLDVNDIRKAFRKRGRGANGSDQIYNELADEVEDIARAQSQNFGAAIDEFAARSLRGEGVEAGRKAATAKTSEFAQSAKVKSANSGAGQRVGARSEVEDIARKGASSAQRLVKRLGEEGDLTKNLRQVLPEGEVAKIQEVARLQSRAGENISNLSPNLRAQGEEGSDLVTNVARATAATFGDVSSIVKANVAAKIGKLLFANGGAEVSEKVAKQIAEDVFNPKKTQQVIAAMRRGGASDDAIADLYVGAAVAAGAAPGIIAGG